MTGLFSTTLARIALFLAIPLMLFLAIRMDGDPRFAWVVAGFLALLALLSLARAEHQEDNIWNVIPRARSVRRGRAILFLGLAALVAGYAFTQSA